MSKIQDLLQTMNLDSVFVRNTDGRILYANQTFSNIFCGGETAIGHFATDVLPQALLDRLADLDQQAASSADTVECQYEVEVEGGQRSYHLRHVIVLDDDDGSAAICTVLRDNTERAAAVREIEILKEEAEAASLIKSRFLTNMSHELRTPLNSIIGYAELLLDDAKEDLARQEDLRRIRMAGADLLRLVDEVLDF